MAYRDLGPIDDIIIKAVIELGAKEGVRKTTSRKIAKMCDISTFTIFEHFKTKRGYLDAAAESFDTPYMKKVIELANSGKSTMEIWDIFIEYFLKEPQNTLYYISYTYEFGFDPTIKNPRADIFLNVAKSIFGDEYTDDVLLLLWDFITSMAFYYAEKIIHGYLPNNEDTKEKIRNIVFKGLPNYKR